MKNLRGSGPIQCARLGIMRNHASEYAARYARALNLRWQPRYRVGVVSGERFDKLAIQNQDLPVALEYLAAVERSSGHLIGLKNPLDPKSIRRVPRSWQTTGWKSSHASSQHEGDPIVSYRLAEEEDFAAAVLDADVYGSFLHLPRLPYVQSPSLDEIRALDNSNLRARLAQAEAAAAGIRAELARRQCSPC